LIDLKTAMVPLQSFYEKIFGNSSRLSPMIEKTKATFSLEVFGFAGFFETLKYFEGKQPMVLTKRRGRKEECYFNDSCCFSIVVNGYTGQPLIYFKGNAASYYRPVVSELERELIEYVISK
jgi:hypothetical protein